MTRSKLLRAIVVSTAAGLTAAICMGLLAATLAVGPSEWGGLGAIVALYVGLPTAVVCGYVLYVVTFIGMTYLYTPASVRALAAVLPPAFLVVLVPFAAVFLFGLDFAFLDSWQTGVLSSSLLVVLSVALSTPILLAKTGNMSPDRNKGFLVAGATAFTVLFLGSSLVLIDMQAKANDDLSSSSSNDRFDTSEEDAVSNGGSVAVPHYLQTSASWRLIDPRDLTKRTISTYGEGKIELVYVPADNDDPARYVDVTLSKQSVSSNCAVDDVRCEDSGQSLLGPVQRWTSGQEHWIVVQGTGHIEIRSPTMSRADVGDFLATLEQADDKDFSRVLEKSSV